MQDDPKKITRLNINLIDLENAIAEMNLCGGMIRTNSEWIAEPHGKVLSEKPVVEILKIGPSDPEPIPSGCRPLCGIKVLDLTRILDGPIAARTLAEHGARAARSYTSSGSHEATQA